LPFSIHCLASPRSEKLTWLVEVSIGTARGAAVAGRAKVRAALQHSFNFDTIHASANDTLVWITNVSNRQGRVPKKCG
jgi:hypothetical protein